MTRSVQEESDLLAERTNHITELITRRAGKYISGSPRARRERAVRRLLKTKVDALAVAKVGHKEARLPEQVDHFCELMRVIETDLEVLKELLAGSSLA